MATFHRDFPYAFHVVPLHAWKSIAASGTLLSKRERIRAGIQIERRSSAAVDRALGFTEHVHCYLSRSGDAADASILSSKLLKTPPFPHLMLRISTRGLADDDCTLCCWNIARSQPRAGKLNGGSWLGHETPEDIADHWSTFRKENPPKDRRRGYWERGLHVPVLTKVHFKTEADLIRRAGQELLLRSPFKLPADTEILSFSTPDSRSLTALKFPGMHVFKRLSKTLPGYGDGGVDQVDPEVRAAIGRYFREDSALMPNLDFD